MSLTIHSHDYFMKEALREAQKAQEIDEVPVGAVVVCDNRIIARCYNNTERLKDVTAHAEILAITAASEYLGSKYLKNCTLYVTLEPCTMCAGALKWSQLTKLVYGAADEKHGFMRYGKELLHPKTTVEFGVLHDECAHILRDFFERKRVLK